MSQKSLSFWTTFCLLPCPPAPNNPENQHFEKMKKKKKKASGDVIILNLHYKKHEQMMYAYSDMECNSHFRPFFVILPHYRPRKLKFGKNVISSWRYYPFKHVHHKSRSYDVQFLRYKVQRTMFFLIYGHFLPFDPPNNPKIQNFEKIKKTPGDIIILNENHMMYGSWNIKSVTDIIFYHFELFFCPFTPLTAQKIKILKKMKKTPGDIIIFTHEYHK